MDTIRNRGDTLIGVDLHTALPARSRSACLILLLVSGAATAGPIVLPAPQLRQDVLAESPADLKQDGSSTVGGLNVFANSPPNAAATGTSIGTSSISLTGPPSILAQAHVSSTKGSGSGNGNLVAGGSASVTYYLEIASGVVGQIPINVFASTGVSVKGAASSSDASATFTLIDGVTNAVVLTATTFDQNGSFHSADVTGDFLNGFKGGTNVSPTPFLATNTLYQVDMVVNASVGMPAPFSDGSTVTGDVTAVVDPSFQLAAGLDPNVYHLVFSAGIQNSTPVSSIPEPSSFAFLGLGLAGLGFNRRIKACSQHPRGHRRLLRRQRALTQPQER